MDFKKYLEENALLINDQLDKILSNCLKEIWMEKPKLTPFALGLINSCKGGKRIRGVLVKLGYELGKIHLRGEKNALHLERGFITQGGEIIKIGAAFEILHAGFLIHDDIEDKSLTRRGQPSLYQALGGHHYGISQAINIGDISLYLPIRIITGSSFSDKVKIKALSHFSQMVINTGWGQVMDIELVQSAKSKVQSEEDREFVNLFKTAKYTIAGPLQIGAILGGAEEKLIRELGEFGENAGVAFQIQDDILDREVVSADEAKLKALKYALKAKKSIPQLTKDPKMSTLLQQMADYLIKRQK